MTTIDFIGDVHANARRLRELLEHLGYVRKGGWTYRHPDPDRSAIFMGDLINRGPDNVAVYVLVRSMVEDGRAQCLLGNHELDAIAWATVCPVSGWPMMERNDVNWSRARAFLNQVEEGSKLHGDMIKWFKTLPLWIETDEFRAVHACWHAESIEAIAPYVSEGRVLRSAWTAVLDREGPAYAAANMLVRGPEFAAACRREPAPVRVRWWDMKATTVAQAAVQPEHLDPATGAMPYDATPYRHDGSKPLFFGHYGDRCSPRLVSASAACVDNYAGIHRPLVAYSWTGEDRLFDDAFRHAGEERTSVPAMAM